MPEHRSERVYLFDLGNSSDGPIGFCARIVARTQEEATHRLKTLLPPEIVATRELEGEVDADQEYVNVYLNPEAITDEDATDPECPICGSPVPEEADTCPFPIRHQLIEANDDDEEPDADEQALTDAHEQGEHPLPVGGCDLCDRRAKAIGYAVLGL